MWLEYERVVRHMSVGRVRAGVLRLSVSGLAGLCGWKTPRSREEILDSESGEAESPLLTPCSSLVLGGVELTISP